MTELTAIISAHDEGVLAGPSISSFLEACDVAERQGIEIERIAVLDRPDHVTREMFARNGQHFSRDVAVEFGDPGRARNFAVQVAGGEFIAFLDGADIWSFNWLTEALSLCRTAPEKFIVHPEFTAVFDQTLALHCNPDGSEEGFDDEGLRLVNYWDSPCLAHRSVYERCPYPDQDIEGGFGFEDWRWAKETLEAGFVHRVAKNTIYFKRRRAGDLNREAATRDVIVRPTAMSRYKWYEDR